MELIFTIILLVLLLLIYFSNRSNKVNRWFAIAVFICWLGVFKEAVLFNVIPYLETVWGDYTLAARFTPAYSALTWALYSFAMPAMIIFSLYFCNLDISRPHLLRSIKALICLPALALSFFFPPLNFRFYQLNSYAFIIAYSAYNLCLGVVYACLLIKGVKNEKPGRAKRQKQYLFWIALTPVLFWLLSASVPHLLGLGNLDKLWQGNVIILLICLISFIVLAFREGFMGLRLSGETYNWNSDMSIINTGAEYAGHMLKSQTTKMEWCIENLKAQYNASENKSPEELAILSRSISTLKSYIAKMKKYSAVIRLSEEPCRVRDMLENAFPPNTVPIHINLPDDIFWLCDKTHMTEVFTNILSNAAEASKETDAIIVTGKYDRSKKFFLLSFADQGTGMPKADLNKMFTPYFTTKNTDKNFGLGLAYCKNVVKKHGGHIQAASEPSRGTTVTIEFPARQVSLSGSAREAEAKDGGKNV